MMFKYIVENNLSECFNDFEYWLMRKQGKSYEEALKIVDKIGGSIAVNSDMGNTLKILNDYLQLADSNLLDKYNRRFMPYIEGKLDIRYLVNISTVSSGNSTIICYVGLDFDVLFELHGMDKADELAYIDGLLDMEYERV